MSSSNAAAIPAQQIEFSEHQIPALESGDYTIQVSHSLHGHAGLDATFHSAVYHFSVAGDRFTLKPDEIVSVFPPEGSLGEHSNVLPHIIFKRSTLAWERQALAPNPPDEQKRAYPWLALLVFDQDELADLVSQQEFEQALASLQINPSGVWGTLVSQQWLDLAGQPAGLARIQPLGARQPLSPPVAAIQQQIETVLNGSRMPKSIRLGQLKASPAGSPYWNPVQLEIGQSDDDLVRVIDVPRSTLEKIMPSAAELRHLAHVRQSSSSGQPNGDAQAVLIANRLPKPGGVSVAHLVVVENSYDSPNPDVYDQAVFQFPANSQASDLVRLVSLKSWSFTCVDERQSFQGLLAQLNHQLLFTNSIDQAIVDALNQKQIPSAVLSALIQSDLDLKPAVASDPNRWQIVDQAAQRIVERYRSFLRGVSGKLYTEAGAELLTFQPDQHAAQVADTAHWWLEYSDADGVSSHYFLALQTDADSAAGTDMRLSVYRQDLDANHTLRLPPVAHAGAEAFLAQGNLPARHYLRQGGATISWYRGPLAPYSSAASLPNQLLGVRAADELVRYDPSYGMFDVSYAAAWELGRLLALRSKHFSTRLYHWKRRHAQQIGLLEQQELYPHLPFAHRAADLSLPRDLERWLADLSLLRGVPFQYLVADERMLPQESIRFFYLDPQWIGYLLHGALSVGRVMPAGRGQTPGALVQSLTLAAARISGILIRSAVVAGWPDLQIDAYNHQFGNASQDEWEIDAAKKLALLRRERLSANVLICLFGGTAQVPGDATVVDIHQHPMGIHFGLDRKLLDGAVVFQKQLRDQEGQTLDAPDSALISPVKFRYQDMRVVDIANLFSQMDGLKEKLGFTTPFTTAQFAMEMVEGAQKVRFIHRTQ